MKTPAKTLSLGLIAALAIGSTPALANDAEVRTVEVRHSDLDLTTEEGQSQLERRIDRAAREVCDYRTGVFASRFQDRVGERCFTAAKRAATVRMAGLINEAQRGG